LWEKRGHNRFRDISRKGYNKAFQRTLHLTGHVRDERRMKQETAEHPKRVTVGCLFAAIGGFCKAFQEKGAVILWANDKDRFAAETFKLNFPDVRYIERQVEELSVHGNRLEAVDVLTAGFPCQAFSIAGEKRGFEDPRGLLFLHIVRIVREFGRNKPKILLLENVKNLTAHDKGRTFKRIQAEIQKAGYWFTDANARIMNTSDYTDIPQNRERVFMVAMSQAYFSTNSFVFPDPSPAGKRRPVRSFLDLQRKADPAFYFTPDSQYYDLFRDAIEEGGREHIYQLRRSYVRKNMSGMCFTLMANMGEGGHNQPVIKDRWGIRKLTLRECARLQGYEDSWFQIPASLSRSQVYKQIGNSVTVPLVARLAESIVQHIQSVNRKNEA
jgi:DNA (cytosine-5)-methyltransferase 1